MNRICKAASLIAFVALLTAEPASTQTPNDEVAKAATPSAWVYVVGAPPNSGTVFFPIAIHGYQAAADGRLTPLPGSPYTDGVPADTNELSIAVNGKYLFLLSEAESTIAAYTIEPDGALTLSHTTDVPASVLGCESVMWDVLDHTGASLYTFGWAGESCSNWSALSFAVDKSNGQVDYLNSAGNSQEFVAYQALPFTFIGNNKFAYGSEGYGSQSIVGFQRNSNGSLTALDIHPPMPKASSGLHYNVWNPMAADPYGNLAVGVEARDSGGNVVGDTQLAVYTADSSGNLSTASTYANMPKALTGGLGSMSISPLGNLLAVSGTNGLQIFHFNGGKQITPYTGLKSHESDSSWNAFDFLETSWDNDSHLYGAVPEGLWVFTVTDRGFSVAPGSPYNLNVSSVAVQTLPR